MRDYFDFIGLVKKRTRKKRTENEIKTRISLIASQIYQQQNQSAPLKQKSMGEINVKMNIGFHLLQPQRLMCELKQMKLSDITRSDKAANASVMDEKFAFLFQCQLHIQNSPFDVIF